MVSTEMRTYPGPESACKLVAMICRDDIWVVELPNTEFNEEPVNIRPVHIPPAE
jgi:hypothetical protein